MPCRPSCSVCVSDCDSSSVLTNCQHFLCARCFNKYPKGQCPRCQKPCKTLLLSAPNLPREVMDRLQYDVRKNLTMALQAMDFQQRLEQGATARLKEMVTGFNQQLRLVTQQLAQAQQHLQHKTEECKALQVEVNVLRDQLREVHHGGGSRSGAMHASAVDAVRHHTPAMVAMPPAARSPSGFRPDTFAVSLPRGVGGSGHAPDQPPMSPFGGLTPAPQQQYRQHTQTTHNWSPSAAATPLGWSRSGVGPKRLRHEEEGTTHHQGGTQQQHVSEQRFCLASPGGGGGTMGHSRDHAQALSAAPSSNQHASVPLIALSHSRAGEGQRTPTIVPTAPLPKLQSLLPAVSTARVVHSSSGHHDPSTSYSQHHG